MTAHTRRSRRAHSHRCAPLTAVEGRASRRGHLAAGSTASRILRSLGKFEILNPSSTRTRPGTINLTFYSMLATNLLETTPGLWCWGEIWRPHLFRLPAHYKLPRRTRRADADDAQRCAAPCRKGDGSLIFFSSLANVRGISPDSCCTRMRRASMCFVARDRACFSSSTALALASRT